MPSPPSPTTIPIIDFSPFTTPSPSPSSSSSSSSTLQPQKDHVARQLDTAFRTTGFVYLRNFGIEREIVDEMFRWSKRFFDLPMEKKMLAPHPPGGSHHRGYSAPGVEKVSQHVYGEEEVRGVREIPDYKESYESGNPHDVSQPNIYPPPTLLPGFQPFLETYFTHCSLLIHRLLTALTLSLRLNLSSPSSSSSSSNPTPPPPTIPDLSPTHSQSLFQLRLLHYPAIPASELKNNKRSRINAHSDFGTLTLLWQDSVGGLEILRPKDAFADADADEEEEVWQEAPYIPDTVLVNIGDLMARWSNERWRSSVHRVGVPRNPSSHARASTEERGRRDDGDRREEEDDYVVPDRYSIPFFATADPETVIEALPGTWGEEGEKKFESVTAWGYVQMRMKALYEG